MMRCPTDNRPVRVTVPRALPTDDVLILRDKKGEQSASKKAPAPPPSLGRYRVAGLSLIDANGVVLLRRLSGESEIELPVGGP